MSTDDRLKLTEDRLTRLERGVAALVDFEGRFKPIPLARSAPLRELVEAHAGGNETRPHTTPEHRQVGGVVR